MSGAVADAAGLVLFPIGAAGIGAVVAAVRRLSDNTTGLVQHFAGGVVFAAVAGEVLPSLRNQHSLRAVLIGFTIGVATVVALRAYERRAEKSDAGRSGLPKAMLAAIVIDLLIDGLLVGMGAALGEGQGRTLTIALTLEQLGATTWEAWSPILMAYTVAHRAATWPDKSALIESARPHTLDLLRAIGLRRLRVSHTISHTSFPLRELTSYGTRALPRTFSLSP